MRKTFVLLAVLGLMSASPALANIVTYTPVTGTGTSGDIGLYNPADASTLNTVFVDEAVESDILEFDFAIMMDATFWAESISFSFMYDNSSLDVIGASPIGDWDTYNYENYEWPNSEAGGEVVVNGLAQAFTGGSSETLWYSSAIPFLHVTLHVNGGEFSALNDFGIVAATLHSGFGNVYADALGYFGGTVHVIPEPATASLIIGGIAALAGGFIRRRR